MGKLGAQRAWGVGLLALALVACTRIRPLPSELGVAPGPSPLPGVVLGGVQPESAASPTDSRPGILGVLVRWGPEVYAPTLLRASLALPDELGSGAVVQLEAKGEELTGHQAYFSFPTLPGGPYRLVVSAWNEVGLSLGLLEEAVAVPPGEAKRVDFSMALTPLPQPSPPRVSPKPLPDLMGASPGPTAGPPAVASPRPSVAPPAPVPPAPLPPLPPPQPGPPNFNTLVAQGMALDVMGSFQGGKAAARLEALLPSDRGALADEVATATSTLAQIMLVKAAVAGEQSAALQELGAALRGRSEGEVAALCLMRGAQELKSQWQAACGPSVVQLLQGEANPWRAWRLHQEPIHTVSPDLRCVRLATEQKQWLEAYGGVAQPRQEWGLESPGTTEMLNDQAGLMTGVRYNLESSSDEQAYDRLAGLIAAGHDVPIRIAFGLQGAESWATLALASAVRGPTGGREFFVHEPFGGQSAWMGEQDVRARRWQPLFAEGARWTHMHRPVPMNAQAWRLLGLARPGVRGGLLATGRASKGGLGLAWGAGLP